MIFGKSFRRKKKRIRYVKRHHFLSKNWLTNLCHFCSKKCLKSLFHLLKWKSIKPLIAAKIGLDQIGEWHTKLERGDVEGVVVCLPWKAIPPKKRISSEPAPTAPITASEEKTFEDELGEGVDAICDYFNELAWQ